MSINLSILKGTQDVLPEDQILLNRIQTVLTETFETYGFEPLDTPAIEMQEILTSKYAGGEEILKEIYTLNDRGNRALALRYDLTVPFARVYGMYKPQLPFKRYQIGKVWRDGPTGLGRYREFYQCDVDVIGVDNMLADAEFVQMASDVFSRLGIQVVIKVNNRKLLNGMVEEAGVPPDQASTIILILDKLDKIGHEGIIAECVSKGIAQSIAERLLEIATASATGDGIPSTTKASVPNQAWDEGARELDDLVRYATSMGVANLRRDPTLARGLAYYTGTIFEVTAPASSISSAIAGGGRYDKMVSSFLDDGRSYPAVGISFGMSRILDVIKERQLPQASVIKVYTIPFPEQLEFGISLTRTLRSAGIPSDFEKVTGRSLKTSLRFMNEKRIPFAVIIGQEEAAQGKYKLRDMSTGQEELLDSDEIVQRVHSTYTSSDSSEHA